MNHSTKRMYEFGSFRFDATERELLRDGQIVPLTPKVAEILLVLLENRGHTLSKDELMARVWPGIIVEEANLTQNISVLRRALGENSGTEKFIETIPKRGYRFIAEVRERVYDSALIVEEHSVTTVTIDPGPGSSGQASPKPKPGIRFLPPTVSVWVETHPRIVMVSSMGAITMLVIGAIFWFWIYSHQQPEWLGELHSNPFFGENSLQGGMLSDSRFSPNGQMIAYSKVEIDAEHIWIRQIQGTQPRQVTTDSSHDSSPIWSPDGSSIAYISDRDHRLAIWMIPFLGGTPELLRVLSDDPKASADSCSLLTWSKQSSGKPILYYKLQGQLYRFDQMTQSNVQLTKFESPFRAYDFSLSPDESQATFIARKQNQLDVWRVVLADGRLTQVTNEPSDKRFPHWDRSGKWLFFNSQVDGQQQLKIVESNGGQSVLLRVSGMHDYPIDVSEDGHQLLCYGERQQSDLFSVGVGQGTTSEHQLTDYLGAEFWPSVAPGGEKIAFHFLPGEQFDWNPQKSLLRVRTLTDQVVLSALTASQGVEPRWSPDGKWVAFLKKVKSFFQLLIVRPTGGEEKVLVDDQVWFYGRTAGMAFNTYATANFSWSPDSKQIAYCTKSDGLAGLHVIDVETGHDQALASNTDSNQTFHSPIWSPDGQRLAWIVEAASPQPSARINSVWGVAPNSEQPKLIWQTGDNLRLLGWEHNSELILATVAGRNFNRGQRADIDLIRLPIDSPSPQLVRELPAAYLSNVHLSPDARSVSIVSASDGKDNIQILSLANGDLWRVTNNTEPTVFISSLTWSPDSKTIYFGKQTRKSVLSIINNQ